VRHLLLFGEYDLNIDEKSRLLVPSEIRRQIDPERDGEAFFVITGVNRVPWMYPERYYEELVSRRPAELTPTEYVLAFDQLNFALASRVEWDKAGRVLIPDKTLKRAGLQKEVTLIGVRDHLELWNRKDWELRRQALEQKIPEIALLAKQQSAATPAP
jgi:MraZ protein